VGKTLPILAKKVKIHPIINSSFCYFPYLYGLLDEERNEKKAFLQAKKQVNELFKSF